MMAWSQIFDNFSDANFTANPIWVGEQNVFKINSSFQLQINQLTPRTDRADTAYLSTFLGLSDSLEWSFSIRLAFSPSDNNNARVYLIADGSNLEKALNGYYLQFGEAGSLDAVELFRQQGTQIQSICRGTAAKVAAAFDSNIKVVYKKDGSWTVWADWNKSGVFVQECAGQSTSAITNPYFGYFCKFTSSNATKFYLDNVQVNSIYVDLVSPIAEKVEVVAPNQLRVKFNEALDLVSAENRLNYFVQENEQNPGTAQLLLASPTEVNLTFEDDFIANKTYTLVISAVKDKAENQMESTLLNFVYGKAELNDVVFNEVMADPSPVVGLPDIEYLEIYNRASYSVNLTNWKLKIGDTEKPFPSITLNAGEYLILCGTTQAITMAAYGKVAAFASFALLNAAQTVALIDENNQTIDVLMYSETWYADAVKLDGGWSLEKIQPDNICLISENWKASVSSSGGTPGARNSIFSETVVVPKINSVLLKNDSVLFLSFNQTMNPISLLNVQNYVVNNAIGNPSTVLLSSAFQTCELHFESKFSLGTKYQLSISSALENCIGQYLSGELVFSFELPKTAEYGDVIISEIMADPSPVQALPEVEYIELYNRTNYPILLNGWRIEIGASKYTFPDYTLAANSFVLLSHADAVARLATFGNVLGFSSFTLANTGTAIVLKNPSNQLIHYINYSDSWYGDNLKAEGGWSLEMISTNHFCEQSVNWLASQHANGGTPGSTNSLGPIQADYQSPQLLQIEVLDENTLSLVFSKSMDSLALKNPQNYSADNGLGNPAFVTISAPEYSMAKLSFATNFAEDKIYQLEISNSIVGCCGVEIQNPHKLFALPQEPEIDDIVINEILFDSWLDNGGFIELFNRSSKVIESKQLLLSRIVVNALDTTYYTAQLNAGQIFPEEYLVICKNKESVLLEYAVENPDNLVANAAFPLLTNTEGTILLSKAANRSKVIDIFSYKETMHHPLLSNRKGVSLERLSPNEETNRASNWSSAAADVNYGTPTYQNSQLQAAGETDDLFQISPELFSPDMDGIDDILQVNYNFSQSGYTLNLLIFNAQGRQINHLVKNELMGTSGQIFWNGATENGDKAPIGIYILYFEYFDLSGKVEKLKKICVLGGKL